MKRYSLHVAMLAIAGIIGLTIGTSAADSIAETAARQHNAIVIATTEISAHRYSVCFSGDQNLIPEWAKTQRIPMFELDEYYR